MKLNPPPAVLVLVGAAVAPPNGCCCGCWAAPAPNGVEVAPALNANPPVAGCCCVVAVPALNWKPVVLLVGAAVGLVVAAPVNWKPPAVEGFVFCGAVVPVALN